jgi:hypothetical protein
MSRHAAAFALLACGCFSDPPPVGTDTSGDDTTATDTSVTASDDGPTDASADATTSTDDTAGAGCTPDSVCVPAPPPGWLGPVAFAADDARPPSCGESYPTEIATLHEGVDVGSSACHCECSGPTPACSAMLVVFDDLGCEGSPSQGLEITPGECNALFGDPTAIGVFADNDLMFACEPTATDEIAPWAWMRDIAVCGLEAAPPVCDVGVCAPLASPSFTPLCIYREGEHDCPDGWDERHLFHGDARDTRACEPCECTIVEPDCSPQVYVSDDAMACANASGPLPPSCISIAPEQQAVSWEPLDAGSCTPMRTQVQGEVTPIAPATACCRM